MRILVLSDSHSTLRFMRSAVEKLKPDSIVHLGDFFQDGQVIKEECPHISFYQVPGNCDNFRMEHMEPETLCCKVCGVRLFMTHGHKHYVKTGLYYLKEDAKASFADAALFGHTHTPYCKLEDGLWVLNPGSCGNGGRTVGIIEAEAGQIIRCKILQAEEWEEIL
ncbi:MAG: YfcE family phosphodiesterase [Ruminococcaceae bacterium]|nr:YfcE family phosphodiesterase [Oscillospiraceae bacterium]